jgi:predicted 3-demethylubiquinone-9 3-methyltransferase (glyoxalase superfamily)
VGEGASRRISPAAEATRPPEGRDLWTKVSADEQTEQCGWLKNKYGLSRQIVPSVLPEMMNSKEPAKRDRAFAALMKMKKLDIAALKRAYDGK